MSLLRVSTVRLARAGRGTVCDVRSTHYRRSFVLSRELERQKIEANLKDGVLTIRIPKRAELRPRKIEVQ